MNLRKLLTVVGGFLCLGCGGDFFDLVSTPPGDRDFAYSPGGDSLLVTYGNDSTPEELTLVVRSTGDRTPLGFYGARVSWIAGRPEILVSLGTALGLLRLSDMTVQPLPFPGMTPFGAWHPSAPIMAVTSNNAVNTNPPDVWLADSIGGAFRRVQLSGPPRNQTNLGAWSPDGVRLVASEIGRLVVFDSSANQVSHITPEDQYAESPDWSPGGEWIAYQDSDGAFMRSDICIVRPDGTDRRKIFTGGMLPRWHPSGSRIGFVRFHDGVFAVWSVDTLGKDLRQETFPE